MSGDARIEVFELVVRYGETTAVDSVSFAIAPGELVTLLGPSGCGKTTTLRAIAGLETPYSGSIRLNGNVVWSANPRRNIPAEKRGVSMVFQSYAIWPHMTVFENVAYGLRVRGTSSAEINANVARVLDMVQMGAYADRPSSNLSGGQQQRVAVARAIAFSPTVVLFDEPLSNLDAKLRAEMRVELRELQRRLDITSLYVTHDQEEALAISDRVIVMNGGQIEQIGSPEDIYNRPVSRFVADFVGSANMIPGHVKSVNTDGSLVFETNAGTLIQAAGGNRESTTLALRSSYIHLRPDEANAIPGTIHRRMFHGDFIQYIIDWPDGQLIVRRPPTELLEEGSAIAVSFAPEYCVLL
jgi:ABC-type Fe3+/spermidine/putrescine transport system ATPase subunit